MGGKSSLLLDAAQSQLAHHGQAQQRELLALQALRSVESLGLKLLVAQLSINRPLRVSER